MLNPSFLLLMNWLLLEASARYYYFTLWELRLTYGKRAGCSLD